MGVFEKLKKAGFRFNRKKWPAISSQELRDLGISPTELREEFGRACLEQTSIGNRPRIGFMLMTGNNSGRPLFLKKDRVGL